MNLRIPLDQVRGHKRAFELSGEGPIKIHRDEQGTPHVRARDPADLFLGLGFCHAVDRPLQLTLARVLGQGRACELVRDDHALLGFDRFFRRMNFTDGAADEVDKLSFEHRRLVEAYCAGVNQGLARGRPAEMRVLRFRPEPWTVADCVLLLRVLGYFVLAQSQGDVERFIVEMSQRGVSAALLQELFPTLGPDFDEDLVRDVRLGEHLVPHGLAWGEAIPRAAASNAWAIAGWRSELGAPLLASDPHLEVNRLPALWYEAVLERPDRFFLGATIPGVPTVVVGRTNDAAWGVTYSCMDAHDSWVEECRDGSYRRDVDGATEWVPFRSRREVIRRRRHADEELTFYENDHGVLLGDPFTPGRYLAERWSGSRGTGAVTLAAAFDLLEASDASTAMDALARIETAWTFVVADRHGSIGAQMSGLLPFRRDDASGLAPLPGWDPSNDWRGFVPPQELPRERDPELGYVVAANHDINHLCAHRPINLQMGLDRAERIAEVLDATDDASVEAMQRLQMDVLSRQAIRYMRVLRPVLPATHQGALLRGWDHRYDADSLGAYLFEVFYSALIEEVFGRVLGRDVMRFLLEKTGMVAGYYDNFDRILLDETNPWYAGERRDDVFARVVERALRVTPIKWGQHQRFIFSNVVLGGRLPRWTGFDVGPVPLRGTRATVHQGQRFGSGARRVAVGPSYRFVTDMSQASALTSLPGGASERRTSPWYADRIADWLAGRAANVRPGR